MTFMKFKRIVRVITYYGIVPNGIRNDTGQEGRQV